MNTKEDEILGPLIKKIMGEKCRKARLKTEYQVANKVAYKIGVSENYMSSLELGRTMVKLPTLYRLANLYGVGVADLIPSQEEIDRVIQGEK